MMNYFSSKKKWMAYLILLTFVFTCIVPTNLAGGNSAWADTIVYEPVTQLGQDKIVDIPGVTVKVFNYDSTVNTVKGSLGSQGYSFFHSAYGPYTNTESAEYKADTDNKLGSVDGRGAHASETDSITNEYNRPVMNATLNEAGYPVTAKGSLGYLFGAHQPFLKGIMNNGGGLFQVDDKDYYYYNSAQNAAYYDSSINKFRLYNINVVPYYNDGDGSGHGGNFLPFNQIEGCVEPFENKTGSGDYDAKASGPLKNKYRLKVTSPTDNWYGMTVEFKFMMPAGGRWNGDNMVFNFSGDDDVWVYIDNQLVMDMGGTHGVHTGSIDFANGMTTYQHNEDSDGNTSTTKSFSEIYKNAEGKADLSILQEVKDKNGNITGYRFKDYTEHTFKFFYMERGGNISNCSISFNMPISETERTVTKVWEDDNDRDGIRPEKIMVQLSGDNNYTTTSALTHENNWTVTWDKLPKYHGIDAGNYEDGTPKNGHEIEYTIEELDAQGDPIPLAGGQYSDKYTTTYPTTGLETIITNTYEPETISISGKKTWNDADDQDGKRPDRITVNLLADGVEVAEKVVTESDNWEYTFDGENLWKYRDDNKPGVEPIVYTVTEDVVYDYTTTITGYDIANTHIPETINIPVEKVWNDKNNQDGKRSDITVELLANGDETGKTLALTKANDWSGIFENVDKYANKQEIVYSLKEVNVPNGYTSEITGDKTKGFVVTNSRDTEKTSVSGYKTWADNDDAAGKRPDKINVWLLADGVRTTSQAVTYDANDVWFYSFTDLDKYRDGGQEIVYSVEEEAVTYYQPVYDKDSYNIKNVYKPGETPFIQIKGIKTWLNDKAEQRPENVTIELLQNGNVTTSQAITADMNWEYDFGTYPKYDDQGKPYTYTVREKDVPAGYVSMVAGFDITNTLHNGEIGQFTVEKDVTGTGTPPADEKFGFRLSMKATEILWNEALKDELEKLKDNHTAAKTKRDTLVAELDNMTADFKVYTTASAYQLVTVKSISSSPSVYQYTMLDKAGRMEVATSSALDFWGNTPAHDKSKDVIGEIIKAIRGLATDFSSMSNRASVFLRALGDEVTELLNAFGAAVEINETDVNLILDKQNQLFDAQVQVEATSDAVYQFEQKASTPSAVTLIVKNVNSGATETIEMDLKDLSDTEYYRPDGTLLKDGEFYLADGEKYSFIAIAADGVKIEYIVVEDKYETENYKGTDVKLNGKAVAFTTPNPSIVGTTGNAETDEILFVNNYEKSGGGGGGTTYINRTVEKVWNDNNNPDRPSSITVNLLKNGVVHDTVTLSAANGWDYNWYNLDAGYTWTVQEVNVAEGYTASVAKSGTTFIITNTYSTPEENIPDENVPTGSVEPGEPLDELEDPEIPLGDAPATGDTNNAAPFMAMMMFALCGLVITRRKFN